MIGFVQYCSERDVAGGCGTVGNKNVERVEKFEPGDVRRIQVGHYDMRYMIVD